MKPRTRFMKMVKSLPEKARTALIMNAYSRDTQRKPMTLTVCYFEIKEKTIIGDRILKELGFVE